ncbi:hypothetical protein GXW83_02615 [Streptacidiphilus sp. PB12-B1b]|uniref:hypothetical protein n=1 Tax=Streptacidiphilus sp. PB12-B1b TaxID=2705012 RepID=UPI0015FAEFA3|nr:hypothetical protein [Streptacidiphilus sp. PB12-B1b]QMU74830.1 hypothetical protein GXW83_02615 [Streptacidiphilus sp. PB12-B1b]
MSLHWNEQVTALANAAAGLQETADAWYDDLPRFLVPTGQLTGRQYADTVMARNAAAWQHLLVVMECVPAMLPQVLAAARRQDYRSGPISEDLGQLTGLNNRVGAIVRVREEWLNVQALMNAAHPGGGQRLAGQVDALRNEEAWRHTAPLAHQTAALARAADHLSHRVNTLRQAADLRRDAALTRSAAPGSTRARQPSAPAARSAQQPVNRHTR